MADLGSIPTVQPFRLGVRSGWDAARESGTDLLEDCARRRAIERSDTLLIFLLKARRPHVYREPRGPVAAAVAMDPDDWQAVERAREVRHMSAEEVTVQLAEIEEVEAAANRAQAIADALPRRGNGRVG
jgi:hypothetical protein